MEYPTCHLYFLGTLLHEIFATLDDFEKFAKLKCHKKKCREILLPPKLSDVLLKIKLRSVATFVKRYLAMTGAMIISSLFSYSIIRKLH